ncbi:hypothetical protein ASPWEDRAFT_29289 [Aspergillus wentii DTO 134E9]|uniref:SNF2 N-terminal domain-containing protein n=1 Tax=Aspergillus wentii DTO 134E9 TaxID=1073089 RepID=A0A1L9RGR7_ASPWE|nr:uncharacterized protein ASPWEDRAFT_29289 [Aspergillus wentii DTO 134E9]KAI9927897.1 hypothetical protein MW887_002749 [Aspergillus wentii]OJJ34121.1 hypothetical protein ASPWEDRAFT_29289 [Aspergillus wentii DTO 134E9]
MTAKYERKSCGIPGVEYDLKYVQMLDQKPASLAGALALPSTDKLWALYLDDVDTKNVIKDWIAYRANSFDHQGIKSGKLILRMSAILTCAFNPAFHIVMTASNRPRVGVQNVTEDTLAPLTCLWYVLKLIQAKPTLFPRSTVGAGPLQLDPYDVLQGWKLLSLFTLMSNTQRIPSTARRHKATAPVYHRQSNEETPSTQQSATAQEPEIDESVPQTSDEIFGLTTEDLTTFHDELNESSRRDRDNESNKDGPERNVIHEVSSGISAALCYRFEKGIIRPQMPEKHRLLLIDYLVKSDNFSQTCILYEPKETSISEQLSSDGVLARLMANSEPAMDWNPTDMERHGIVSAQAPGFQQACATLGLDPKRPVIPPGHAFIEPTMLKPLQMTGLAWMLQQEESPIKGGILADARELGTILISLALVWFASQRASQLVGYFHRPTLVVCPPKLIDAWQEEVHKQFSDKLDIIMFYGLGEPRPNLWWKCQTVNTLAELRETLSSLDSDSADTSRTIVLTTYETWAQLTTHKIDCINEQGNGGVQKGTNEYASGDQDEKLEKTDQATNTLRDAQEKADEDTSSIGKRVIHQRRQLTYQTQITGLFSRVIADESDDVRKTWTRTHRSLSQIGAEHVWLLSPKPLGDIALDLCGYSSLLCRDDFDEATPGDGADCTGVDKEAIEEYRKWSNMTDLSERQLHLHLSLHRLAALATGGHLTTRDGNGAIPVIMRLICLQRGVDDSYNIHASVDDDIPPFRIMTVELKYSQQAQKEHDLLYGSLVARLHKGKRGGGSYSGADGVEKQCIDEEVLQRLCHLAFFPKLDQFVQSVGGSKALLAQAKKYVEGDDRGFSFFHVCVSKDRAAMAPETRLGQAHYLAHDCPKLRYFAIILLDEGAFEVSEMHELPKFLILVNWPLVQYIVEMFIDALSIEYATVSPSMSPRARMHAVEHFTSKDNHCQVLITTFSCGDLSFNLHHHCSRVIVLEPTFGMKSLFEVIGQVHRPGQGEKQKIFILFQDHTISRWLEYRNTICALPHVASQLRDIRKTRENGDIAGTGSGVPEMPVEAWADHELSKLLGQPRSRLGFKNVEDLGYDPISSQKRKQGGGEKDFTQQKKARGEDCW